jgi:hypothetical protein
MTINDNAQMVIEKFAKETNIISMDGEYAEKLIKVLIKGFNENNREQKSNYIKDIKDEAKNNGYDENGVLCETQRILNVIERGQGCRMQEIDDQSKSLTKECCMKTHMMTMSGLYSGYLQKTIKESIISQYKDVELECVNKIKNLAKKDGYDANGLIVQTSIVIKSIDLPVLRTKQSRKPG